MDNPIHAQKKKVDDTIHKLHVSKELAIRSEANQIRILKSGSYHKDIMTGLTDAIFRYETGYYHDSEPDYHMNRDLIHDCYFWIQKAEDYQAFTTSELEVLRSEIGKKNDEIASLNQKLQDVTQSHDALAEELNKVRDDLIDAKAKLEHCDAFVDRYMKYLPKAKEWHDASGNDKNE